MRKDLGKSRYLLNINGGCNVNSTMTNVNADLHRCSIVVVPVNAGTTIAQPKGCGYVL